MKRRVLVFTLYLFSLYGCSENEDQYNFNHTSNQSNVIASNSNQGSFRSIPPHIAKRLIDFRSELLILDVRTPEEMRYTT
jgi:hypothetical protein